MDENGVTEGVLDTWGVPSRSHNNDMQKKRDLPTKTCPVCERPFTWRKRWEAVWNEVKYCSAACRQRSRRGAR